MKFNLKILNKSRKIITLYIIFFIININYKVNSFLIFPLEYLQNDKFLFSQNANLKPQELVKQIFYKNLITKFEMGTPPKNISLFIELNDDKFYIASAIPSKLSEENEEESELYKFTKYDLYNELLSSSFDEGICKIKVHEIYHYSEMCTSKEKINFNLNNKIYQREFPIKIVRNNDENIPGVLGLLLNDTYYGTHKSFINDLKDEKLIDNYYWVFNINEISPLEKKIKGNFIVGGLLHEVYPEKYSSEQYKYTHPYVAPSSFKSWKLKFDNIIMNGQNNYSFLTTITSFSYKIYHIIGTNEFHYKIKNIFLNKLIKEQKCFRGNFTQDIYIPNIIIFYYCDISTKDILYKNLNSINFNSIDLDYKFELKKEDLFYIKDNYIYLNIVFSTKDFGFWILGQLFLTKYNFVFNSDKKEIGFYNLNNISNLNTNKSNKLLIIIIIIIISLVFTCIGIIIGRKIYGIKRKIIVNELIEEQNYDYRINKDSNNIESNYKPIGNNKNNIFEMSKKFSE